MQEIKVDQNIEAIFTPQESVMQDPLFGDYVVKSVTRFHRSMDIYKATPLAHMKNMAKRIGVESIYVKDESHRFGLNAFKVVGGVYGLANVIARYLGIDFNTIDFNDLKQESIKDQLNEVTIMSVTDGNHGRGLAWAGAELDCNVIIYMPKGSAEARVQALTELGAEVHVTDLNYDDTLRLVIDKVAQNDKLLHVQDQAWPGYEEIPNWISQGYMTIADEALTQIYFSGDKAPTHVFLQAGAGSMALGIASYFANQLGDKCPKIVIMEAKNANCYFESIRKGESVRILGDLDTIMAGLSVGEVNTEGFRVIPHVASAYLSCADTMSKYGTRLLAAPQGEDPKVISGESGSVGAGVLNHLMLNDSGKELRETLNLNENSRVLLFSTEGDTDPDLYQKIVFGDYS